jgi:hypothetical protein
MLADIPAPHAEESISPLARLLSQSVAHNKRRLSRLPPLEVVICVARADHDGDRHDAENHEKAEGIAFESSPSSHDSP